MEIMRSIERVLKLGCGLDLQKVLRSKRYDTLRKRSEALMECYPASRDKGVALRAGHLEFGRLINAMGEQKAIREARDVKPEFGPSLELFPLIQIVGEKLVQAATNCLTPEIKAMAKSWKTVSADQQFELCRKLYYILLSTSQVRKTDGLTPENALEGIDINREANRWSNKKMLPRRYGLWNPDTCVANCQGKTQMIVAFARLAGARVVLVHPLEEAAHVVNDIRRQIYSLITDDLQKRGLTHLDSEFKASLEGFLVENGYKQDRHNFHVCAGVELSDGRWVLIDSHSLNFGLFPDIWGVPAVVKTLDRYKDVLPGLEIRSSDQGRHKTVMTQAVDRARELIERSRRFEESIRDANSPVDVADKLFETGEIWFLLEGLSANGVFPKEMLVARDPNVGRYASLNLVVGENPLVAAMLAMTDQEGYVGYMTKRKHILLSSYHYLAIDSNRSLADEGKVLHPVCDFARAEYSIAISAINSLVEENSYLTHRFFVEYSFDQVTLHNALIELVPHWLRDIEERERSLGMAAARCLRSLPVMHPLCLRKLRLLGI